MPDPPSKNILDDLSYPSEKPCVVIDMGHSLTKCGVAGEFCPRWIVPTVAVKSRVGETPLHRIGESRSVWDYKDAADLRSLLLDYFNAIYFQYLLVNPKERSVLMVESVLWPTIVRECIADVLFNHYEVPALLLAPAHLLSLLPLGSQTGLVLDVGYEEATVVPVFQGVSVLKAWQAAPLGSRALHESILELLGAHANLSGSEEPVRLSEVPDWRSLVPERTCEDVKVRACFVTRRARAAAMAEAALLTDGGTGQPQPQPQPQPTPSDFEVALNGGRLLRVSGCVRELACEPLHALDADERSLAALVLDSIVACPIDLRKPMAHSLVVTGGTAMLPGFMSRLHEELHSLLRLPKYERLRIGQFKYHNLPAKRNYAAWLGGAIMAGLEVMSVRAVTREQLRSAGRMPDWVTPRDEQRGLARR